MKETIICLICAIVALGVCYLVGWCEIVLLYHPTGVYAPVMSGCITYGMITVFIFTFGVWMITDIINENKKHRRAEI